MTKRAPQNAQNLSLASVMSEQRQMGRNAIKPFLMTFWSITDSIWSHKIMSLGDTIILHYDILIMTKSSHNAFVRADPCC